MEVLFSFGSWKGYPYQNGFVIIDAPDKKAAIEEFRRRYPDKTPGVINCSDIYTDKDKIKTFTEENNLGAGCHKYISLNYPKKFPYKTLYGDEKTIIPRLVFYPGQDMLLNKERLNIGLYLYEIDGNELEPYGVITKNFGEFIAMKNVAYIDTNNFGEGIIDWMEENKWGIRTSLTKTSGFCQYPLFSFNENFLKSISLDGTKYYEYENLFNEYYDAFTKENDEPDICDEF